MVKGSKSQGWSPAQVTIALSIALLVLTWMVSASAYATARHQLAVAAAEAAGDDQSSSDYLPRVRVRRVGGLAIALTAMAVLLKNSIVEVPHAPQVIWHVLTERWLIPIGFVVMEGVVIGIGVGLSIAERTLEKPKKRKPTVPVIRIAKPSDD